MLKNAKRFFISSLIVIGFSSQSLALDKKAIVSPEDIIKKEQQAQYFEKWLGVIEVGKTTKKYLELYTGEGETIKKPEGEKSYYIDKKNNKTLIVETNHQDVIEVATYKNYIDLPSKKKLDEIKSSKKMNIKNLMTSMGSRMGYSPTRIMNAYGRPSVEVSNKDEREFKYIMLGNFNPKLDFVYLEYSFLFKKNKVAEIRIENGK
ncbi:MAG: hypothetical protein H7263_03745 [Candidatus Sericytochromatia bacterium]|nr:hypothetical protein [Candidatus Sericytochromatia bacterium]